MNYSCVEFKGGGVANHLGLFSAKTGRHWADRDKPVHLWKECKPRETLKMDLRSQVRVNQRPTVGLSVP